MVQPTREEFERLGATGLSVPIHRTIFADFDTPVSAFAKIDDGRSSFLLESVEGGETWGRYSFLGSRPAAVFRAHHGACTLERDGKVETLEGGDPFAALDRLLEERRAVDVPGLPRFAGGAVGFFSYDVVRHLERLPATLSDDLDVPDAVFHFTDVLTIFDSHQHTMKVVAHARPGADPKKAYDDALARIDQEVARLTGPTERPPGRGAAGPRNGGEGVAAGLPGLSSTMDRARFEAAVEKAKEYIRAGDIFQVVLSHRLSSAVDSTAFDAYRALRVVNPSPYMYFLRLGAHSVVGSSPEVLVRREGERVEVRPIAGTRPRGATPEEDRRLEQDLLKDDKERSEHVMLVDLGRNDVGRVARYGTVETSGIMAVERYSQVMHLVSNVHGSLPPGVRSVDVVKACFPAGTVSGAPKIRAMEIIEELEVHRRGLYAGAVGYFDLHGNADLCIAIRTLLYHAGRAYLGVGAGIVADSDPGREYEETMHKGRALLTALERAETGLEIRT
ncbi:MAG: anthranilate synthase component I [Candidatus Eisenbacteria bacterium]